jgi:hypothetical protein
MATSNFCRTNTSKVFAVLMNEERTFKECSGCGHKHYDYDYLEEDFKKLSVCENECEDEEFEEKTEYEAPESYEYDDFKSYLRERAEEKVKGTPYIYSELDKSDNANQYTATDLFSLNISKWYGDIEVYLTIIGQIVSAYYEGASLDYRLEIYNGSEDCEVSNGYYKTTVGDILDDLFAPKYEHYESDMNRGLRTILLPKATKWAEKETEKMIDLIEEIFTEVSMPLVVTAQFSNGETHYAKAV